MSNQRLTHRFVEAVPEQLEDGVLYVSVEFATVIHLCCCGCGNEVVTPLSPSEWRLTFDGESISLDPSIGNWNFSCRSHYWIRSNKIEWARRWLEEKIARGRLEDKREKEIFFQSRREKAAQKIHHSKTKRKNKKGFWFYLTNWLWK